MKQIIRGCLHRVESFVAYVYSLYQGSDVQPRSIVVPINYETSISVRITEDPENAIGRIILCKKARALDVKEIISIITSNPYDQTFLASLAFSLLFERAECSIKAIEKINSGDSMSKLIISQESRDFLVFARELLPELLIYGAETGDMLHECLSLLKMQYHELLYEILVSKHKSEALILQIANIQAGRTRTDQQEQKKMESILDSIIAQLKNPKLKDKIEPAFKYLETTNDKIDFIIYITLEILDLLPDVVPLETIREEMRNSRSYSQSSSNDTMEVPILGEPVALIPFAIEDAAGSFFK